MISVGVVAAVFKLYMFYHHLFIKKEYRFNINVLVGFFLYDIDEVFLYILKQLNLNSIKSYKIVQMKEQFLRTIIKNGGSLAVNIPKEIVHLLKLKEGDIIVVGDEKFEVFHTPGHSPGSMCLYSKASKTLISGDTIFSGGWFGRYDFPGGDRHLLKQSIERLTKLDVVNLYPGHEPMVEGDGRRHMMMVLENIRSDLL